MPIESPQPVGDESGVYEDSSQHLVDHSNTPKPQTKHRQHSPSPHTMHSNNSEDLREAEEDESNEGIFRVKRPRTPSSVPLLPVSRKLSVSTKIVKSTESLHVADLVSFGGKDRSPLGQKYSSGGAGGGGSNGDQQFCLKWNSYQTNLSKEFDDLLKSESFVDVTLACDGHSVKAHKMVLSACSPYFQALFFDHPCQHPIIIMKEVKWPELKAVVEYMYRGEINVGRDQIEPLLRVANMLKIRGLTDVDQYLSAAAAPDEIELVAPGKDTRKSPKSESHTKGDPIDPEVYAKRIRELVDINENVEKVFHRGGLTVDGNRVSPASKSSDCENKNTTNLVYSGSGISVRDRDHLMQPDSPIALTAAAVAVAQDRLNRANLATRKRRWVTGGNVEDSPRAEGHRSSSSPDQVENMRESPASTAALLSIHNAAAGGGGIMQGHHQHPSGVTSSTAHSSSGPSSNSGVNASSFGLPQATLESMGLSALGMPTPANTDDMEIKPGIAEMIREEERVSREGVFTSKKLPPRPY